MQGLPCMDLTSLVSALVGAKMAQAQMAVAAKMARMDMQSSQSIADLLDAAQQNMNRLANLPAGVGTQLDITV